MIPKRANPLLVLACALLQCALLTATPAAVPLPENAFNASLRIKVGKSTPPAANGVRTLVIDAGHGGKDPGGMGANSREKHIALRIAQYFAEGVRANFPSVKVILTRNDDTFIPLYERAAIANRAGADLFVSIHANIMPGSSATYGTETFVMGQHVAEHNLAVAKRENAAIFLEEDFEKNYDYDPNSVEGHILLSMFQHAFLERSILFAELVEQQFANEGRKSRGVKQAGFVVLKETTMPSVLVETGFMSNLREEAYLLSEAGQRRLATALLAAFTDYYNITGKLAVSVPALAPGPAPAGPASQAVPPPRDFSPKGIDPPREPAVASPAVAAAPYTYAVPTTATGAATTRTLVPPPAAPPDVRRRELAPRPLQEPGRVVPGTYDYAPVRPVYGKPVADTVPLPQKFSFQRARTKETRQAPAPSRPVDLAQIPDEQLLYSVQIIATRNTPDLGRDPYIRLPYPIQLVREDGWNKYEIRGLRNAAQAREARARAVAAGFQSPMVLVRLDGKKLARQQVRYLLGR